MRRTAATGILITLLIGTLLAQNTGYQQDPNWKAPESAAALKNPLGANPQYAGGGRKLFQKNCAECHGPDGSGLEKKHAADLRLPVVQAQSDGTIFWKITNGNMDRGMPSFSRLPEPQRWQLVLFLRTLMEHGEKRSEVPNP